MRGSRRAANRLPRKSPVIMDATTVATAWWEFPRMRERDLDQATSITRDAAPEKNRHPASTLRAMGFTTVSPCRIQSLARSRRSRARVGIGNRVRGVGVQLPFSASFSVGEVVVNRPYGRSCGVRAYLRPVFLGIGALEAEVIVHASGEPCPHRPHDGAAIAVRKAGAARRAPGESGAGGRVEGQVGGKTW